MFEEAQYTWTGTPVLNKNGLKSSTGIEVQGKEKATPADLRQREENPEDIDVIQTSEEVLGGAHSSVVEVAQTSRSRL